MNWKNLEDYPLKDLQKMWLDYFDKRRFETGNKKYAG